MMGAKGFLIGMALLGGAAADEAVDAVVARSMDGLGIRASGVPHSPAIERMFIGYDAQGEPRVGIAYRTIEAFGPLTGAVVVEKRPDGFVLKEALFPNVGTIGNAKERREVLSILERFRNVPFDPRAEKSAVDGLTGATRHGIRTAGHLNHLARLTALEMEARPAWPKWERD